MSEHTNEFLHVLMPEDEKDLDALAVMRLFAHPNDLERAEAIADELVKPMRLYIQALIEIRDIEAGDRARADLLNYLNDLLSISE